MNLTLMLLMVSPVKQPALFDECLAAQQRLTSFSVHIDIDTSVPKKHELAQYDLSVSGSKTLVRVRQPATTFLDRSDRRFLLTNDKLVGYDAVANERLQRPNPTHGKTAARLIAVLGPIDDALTLALDTKAMKSFFNDFRGFRDWRESQKGSTITIYRSKAGTETMFRFGTSPKYLKEVLIKLKDSKLHWTYSFHSGASVALNIPEDARHVTSFTIRPAPPKFASKEAEQVVGSMLKAYGRLHNGEIIVTSPDGDGHLWLGGLKLREDRAGFKWTYDGKTLSVLNKVTKKFYRGKTIRVTIAEYIVAAGGEVDPLIKYVLAHRVPYADLFQTFSTVKFSGSMTSSGVTADILKVASSNTTFSLFVRHDNHLLDSIEAETVDNKKHIQTEGVRRFKYVQTGESPDSSLFHLDPNNAKVLPLPVPPPSR